ncbi:MAG: FkbM family methyltransferase [Herminiimonas sp.]|nr:FkbM family methyltransferase [Herminiimonas sp.]
MSARHWHCLNACLYYCVADLPFLEVAGTLGGLIDAFDPEQLAHAVRAKHLQLDDAGKPPLAIKRTMTIAAALELANAPRVIDYWSLDTEGTELVLSKSFPFDRYTFNVLTVEHNQQPARHAIRHFLEARGFAYITRLFIDDCYIRTAAFPNRFSKSAVWRHRALFGRMRAL